MGGYTAAPVLIGNGGLRKPHRGGKSQEFSQHHNYPTFMYGGWAEPPRMAGGYYGPAGYGGMPYTMIRGHPGMDPNMIIPTSGMDYMTDQFQGVCGCVCGCVGGCRIIIQFSSSNRYGHRWWWIPSLPYGAVPSN